MQVLIKDLISDLQKIQEGKNWIGTNFKVQLDALSEAAFFHQPEQLYSIAEIISHLITWREETILKLKNGVGSITDADPSNWRPNASLKEEGKDQLVRRYKQSLEEIIDLLRLKNDAFLNETYFDTDFNGYYSYNFVLKGLLHHDIYHLGQIGLIHNLIKKQKI